MRNCVTFFKSWARKGVHFLHLILILLLIFPAESRIKMKIKVKNRPERTNL
jgi:hypothetical protein